MPCDCVVKDPFATNVAHRGEKSNKRNQCGTQRRKVKEMQPMWLTPRDYVAVWRKIPLALSIPVAHWEDFWGNHVFAKSILSLKVLQFYFKHPGPRVWCSGFIQLLTRLICAPFTLESGPRRLSWHDLFHLVLKKVLTRAPERKAKNIARIANAVQCHN